MVQSHQQGPPCISSRCLRQSKGRPATDRISIRYFGARSTTPYALALQYFLHSWKIKSAVAQELLGLVCLYAVKNMPRWCVEQNIPLHSNLPSQEHILGDLEDIQRVRPCDTNPPHLASVVSTNASGTKDATPHRGIERSGV